MGLEPGLRVLRASIGEEADDPGGPLAAALGAHGMTAPPAVTEALVAVATEGPVVILLDEVEAADAGTRYLVRLAVSRAVGLPVLWVLAARPDAAGVRALLPTDRLTEVVLGPLPEGDIARLLQSLVPGALTCEQAVEAAMWMGGNPEFAEESVLQMADEGMLVELDEGSWHLAGDLGSVKMPSTVYDLIETRVDRLPDAARVVLQEASVIGERFDRAVLEQITSLPALLESALGELMAGELIRPATPPDGSEAFVFRGPLVHQIVADGILRRRRAELERRVAETKRRLYRPEGGGPAS
jgi:adenylate cyclase